jgi:L-erythro-3,5-diaminohexanoate dehydrogenase
MKALCRYGTHRVIMPKGVLPQAALQIDATPICHENECLIEVDVLNIDSASFNQIKHVCNNDVERIKSMILDIVRKQGKMQNPITKSGGMLIGKVKMIGSKFHDQSITPGTKIATLVSLSLTPLHIDEIISVNITNEQVNIIGQAILFDSGVFAVIPDDLDEKLVLAALDVAGAPAQMIKIIKKTDTVFIIGAAGKSGILCAYQAQKIVKGYGRVIGLVQNDAQKKLLDEMHLCDDVIIGDATDAISTYQNIETITNKKLCDVTVNVVNVENTEMTSILSTKDQGIVYFFSMATSFTKAALGAEGIKKDLTMLIGNGYTTNHANITLDILRESRSIFDLFTKRYT